MILIFAVGLGVTGISVSLVRSLETMPAPGIGRSDRLVRVRGIADSDGRRFSRGLLLPEVVALMQLSDKLARVAAWTSESALIGTGAMGEATVGRVSYISDAYFVTLGVSLARGRVPNAIDEVVISDTYWRRDFAGDSNMLGKRVYIDRRPVTVVGVGPKAFVGVNAMEEPTAVWLTLAARTAVSGGRSEAYGNPDSALFSVIAQLAPGVSMSEATAAVRAVALRGNTEQSVRFVPTSEVVPLLATNEVPESGTDAALAVLTGLAVLILLVVSVTVGSLLAGSVVVRAPELGVRLALGATRLRVIRLLLTESVVLASGGGALAALVTAVAWGLIERAFAPATLAFDWVTAAGCLLLVSAVGAASGIGPALHATKGRIADALHGTSGTGTTARLGLQRRLVVAQIALTQPLLMGIVVLLQMVGGDARKALVSPSGDHVAVIEFDRIEGTASKESRVARLQRVRERLSAMAGILEFASQRAGFRSERFKFDAGDASRHFSARAFDVDPRYLKLTTARIRYGRAFAEGEEGMIMVGSELARDVWGTQDPTGRRVWSVARNAWLTVAGVVDIRSGALAETGVARNVYFPVAARGQDVGIFHTIVLRTAVPAANVVVGAAGVVREELAGINIRTATTLAAQERSAQAQRLTTASVAVLAGALMLALSAVGLFATGFLSVTQRSREIGIRMALGADPKRMTLTFFGGGARLAATGLALGAPISALTLQYLMPVDQVPIAVPVTVTVLSVGIIASVAAYLPARHAGRRDAALSLRS